MAQAALLPRLDARADYTALRPDTALWLRPIRAICQRHGCATDGLVRLGDGTNVVFATGDGQIVKLFPPYWAPEWEVARESARRIRARHRDGALAWVVPDGGSLWLANGDDETGLGWCSPR